MSEKNFIDSWLDKVEDVIDSAGIGAEIEDKDAAIRTLRDAIRLMAIPMDGGQSMGDRRAQVNRLLDTIK